MALTKQQIFRQISLTRELKVVMNHLTDDYMTLMLLEDNKGILEAADNMLKDIRDRIENMDATVKAWMDAGSFTDEQKKQLRKEFKEWEKGK